MCDFFHRLALFEYSVSVSDEFLAKTEVTHPKPSSKLNILQSSVTKIQPIQSELVKNRSFSTKSEFLLFGSKLEFI